MEGVTCVEIERNGSGSMDLLAVEDPVEIRLQWEERGEARLTTIAVTMRTPGHDPELAVGFLFTEGVIAGREQIADVRSCRAGSIRVVLAPGTSVDLTRLERHSYTTSSCGMCGKTSASALRLASPFPLRDRLPLLDERVIRSLPAQLREAQQGFDLTGGLHASALCDLDGRVVTVREDVGRHNALDKVIGAELLAGRLPVDERVLVVSGRVSFELVQKALMAGIPILAAIGAPSSLAVEVARAAGMTLLGFVRADRFNVYSGGKRITAACQDYAAKRVVTECTELQR